MGIDIDVNSLFGGDKKTEVVNVSDNSSSNSGNLFSSEKQVSTDKAYPKKNTDTVDLFNDTPNKVEIDVANVSIVKEVLFIEASDSMSLSDDYKEIVKKSTELLKEKGYKVRLFCNKAKNCYKDIVEILGSDNVIYIKPWKKFCNVTKGNIKLPSKANIEAAAYYSKNFDNLPTAIKYIQSAWMTALLDKSNNRAVKYILFMDPYYDGKRFDFTKSPDTSNVYFLIRNMKDLNFNILNLALEDDIKTLVSLEANNQ